MEHATVKVWLQRKKSSGATGRLLLASGALLGGMAIAFLTFWFTYAIIWFCVPGVSAVSELICSKKLRLAHEWRLVGSGIFVLLLFIQHLRTCPWHWGDYSQVDVDIGRTRKISSAFGPAAALLTSPGVSANMIADILLSGPRLVTAAWRFWRESRQLANMDVEGCSQLLAFIASRPTAVEFGELRAAGWEDWFEQLRCLDGVIFLTKGISLTPELRQELARLPSN